ncbi:MAG: hypothetical protein Q7U63_19905 [Polaromonas sp.]|uniref:hypothetical protein n=1 Tax=Polaromonas sp. TaxID=1869339 RepID=UPI00271E7AE2|nr:hypothetical protein [Polaromonas sp.]MDO9116051.1 hypothetical protein [Polaromonas sp.]MDP1887339.1 hypothetical protein [Polaromonas sp.]
MSDIEPELVDDDDDVRVESAAQVVAAKETLAARCKAAGILCEEITDSEGEWRVRVGMKSARTVRPLTLWSAESINRLLALPFERYVFLSDLEAICSYSDGTIEAGVRYAGNGIAPMGSMYRRLFGADRPEDFDLAAAKMVIAPQQDGLPHIEISQASPVFQTLSRAAGTRRLTLKLSHCRVTTHDSALALLQKIAGSVLFQVDLMVDIPITLERERRRPALSRRVRRAGSPPELQYPQTQFESAPLSLYWYGRSAAGMPLLQFLAFYQVVEFFFPIYSQSEAHRKLKAILKDPTFRGDRDTDIARLLAAIHVSRSGAYGDERSQLRATLFECTDSDAVRRFLEEDEGRKDFFQTKAKSLPYHKLPLANPSADLRGDVAERVYDIRCKIVHTKTDSRDGSVELLLPFTPEAEQLTFDIELVQYLAQRVLIASSTPLNVYG